MRQTTRRAVRRFGLWLARFLVDGFGALAMFFGMVPPVPLDGAKQWWPGSGEPGSRPDGPSPRGAPVLLLDEPPPAHPERLVAGVPLSPGERELWAQLRKD